MGTIGSLHAFVHSPGIDGALVNPEPQTFMEKLKHHGEDWFRSLVIMAALYLFIASINLMGHGLKTVALVPSSKDFMDQLFGYAAHPLAGLCVGILVTSFVQSSSFTTSFTVTLVAAGQINLEMAIPIIMGANIGTSVTNILVSLAHLTRRLEFRRSLAGAIVHDIFNVLSVLILLPLEVAFGIISRPANVLADWLGGKAFFETSPKKFSFVKMAVKPVSKGLDWLLLDFFGFPPTVAGIIEAAVAIILLFVALFFMVKMLRGLLQGRLSGLFSRTLFRSPSISFIVGIIVTATVQSSSVTTSLVVPLIGAGVLRIDQIYPYTLGANIGTTITSILAGLAAAALATGGGQAMQLAAASGLAVALGHLLFNIFGTCIFWPLKWIPISLAKGYAKLASRRRIMAAVYILVVFLAVPILTILAVNIFIR